MIVGNYEDFISYCDRKLCLRKTIFNEKTCARDTKRKRCFDKYIAKQKDKIFEKDERWEAVRKLVLERDNYECRLLKIIGVMENTDMVGTYYDQKLDIAHVVRRSQSKKLYYDPDNLVALGRTFHSRLDQYKHPLTGKSISREEADNWWIRIIGKKMWGHLQENK